MLARRGSLLGLSLLLGSLVFATSARADEAPPRDPCDSLKVGDACEEWGKKGACVTQSCSRLSYANGEPESVEYDCVRCEFGARPGMEEPAKPVAGSEKPGAEPSAAAEPKAADIPPKGGCSIEPGLGGSSFLILGLGLWGLRRRRR